MNWGIKIILAYLAFVTGILVLMYKANSSHFDLVEPKYYEAELAYQDRMDASQRTVLLSEPLKIVSGNGQIKILFPKSIAGKNLKGNALLYYPADAKKDRSYPFNTQDSFILNPEATAKGWYRIKLNWEVDELKYYYETGIHL